MVAGGLGPPRRLARRRGPAGGGRRRRVRRHDDGAIVDGSLLDAASQVLGAIRKAKTDAKVSMRTPVTRAEVSAPQERLAALALVVDDLRQAGTVEAITLEPREGPIAVHVELVAPEATGSD